MEKIKQFIQSERGNDIFVILVVILLALASFELGRLSKANSSPGVKINYETQEANTISSVENISKINKTSSSPSGQKFFASSRGSKYYPSDCPSGQNIKTENRVYFDTTSAAEQAGYTRSSSC